MANITQYLQRLMNAVYGEEVRGSIRDALLSIDNDVTGLSNKHDALEERVEELEKPVVEALVAEKVAYDNASSGLTGENVQAALDEIDAKADTNASGIASLNSRTTTKTHSLTLSSVQNCTVNACRAYTVGNVCALYLEVKINTNMTAGSEYVLGTLPSGYTPAGIGSIGSSGTTGTILGSGSIRIRPTISQSSGANLYLTATYVMP